MERKLLGDTTMCGMSSSLVQVTVVPAFTVNSCGPNVKFAILTVASAAQTGVAARSRKAATPAKTTFISDLLFDMFVTQLVHHATSSQLPTGSRARTANRWPCGFAFALLDSLHPTPTRRRHSQRQRKPDYRPGR